MIPLFCIIQLDTLAPFWHALVCVNIQIAIRLVFRHSNAFSIFR
jgi:hypothetical protein